MMKIILNYQGSVYEPEHLIKIFYPNAKREGKCRKNEREYVYLRKNAFGVFCAVKSASEYSAKYVKIKMATEKQMVSILFELLQKFSGQKPQWGMLTGVRPVRLVRDMKNDGKSYAQAKTVLNEEYFVQNEKIDLCLDIAKRQQPFISAVRANEYSLYVSIPFCPTRCSYCSFVSTATHKNEALIAPYIQLLCQEIVAIRDIAAQNGLVPASIYIGGGTPTAISADLLRKLMAHIAQCYDIAKLREYTVEAGRPDCTDKEKLDIIKQYGATRISINPQTMDDEVLRNIGRNHTAADIIRCNEIAREVGHTNINMDLIAGLPGDSAAGFANSLDEIIRLSPQSITVHTLTLKRASNLVIKNIKGEYADVDAMLKKCEVLEKYKYMPYYLYRQKCTLSSLENVGYAKPGYEGLYNIYIMEEIHTILAAGAGASTKLCGKDGRIERIFNYKYPIEYIKGFDEIIKRKKGVNDFYASYMDT